MVSILRLLLSSLFFLFSLSHAQNSSQPRALILPVLKDASTLQYVTLISQGTPLVPIGLVLDLGGRHVWVDCEKGFKSSTYRPAHCGSAECSAAKGHGCGQCFSHPKPGCNNKTCGVFPENTVTRTVQLEKVAKDVIALQSTDGSKSGPAASISNFVFSCARTSLLQGLASGVKGMAGLGRSQIGLPTQLAAKFGGSLSKKFAICLSSSTNSSGVTFFGDSPYVFYPDYNTSKPIDISERFDYTPLIVNPVSTAGAFVQGEPSFEYFIGVTSILINRKQVSLNPSLLSINKEGFGGTKISTVTPYTVMETSIYKAFTEAFTKEIMTMNITRVQAVAPFEACFSRKQMSMTGLGPGVPDIELVLQSKEVYWGIYGANSMVEVSIDVMCLGFVDGGSNPRTSVVIGGYQLEDNLLQFDLAASKLGFSSTLLWDAAACANFNFISNA